MSSKKDLGVTECDARIRELPPSMASPGGSRSTTEDRVCQEDDEIVVKEGTKLFTSFIHEELEKKGLDEQLTEQLAAGDSLAVAQCATSNLGDAGRCLRILADDFAKTAHRKQVLKEANEVQLSDINKEQFIGLLQNVFEGGITRERIVVLFFFCSDVTIRALQEKRAGNFIHNLMKWALIFLKEEVCKWVERHGGWAKVLNTSVNYACKISMIVGALAFTAAAAIYIRKNL